MCRSSSYTQHQIAWNKWIITVTMYSIQARRSAPTYLVLQNWDASGALQGDLGLWPCL